MCRHQQAAHHQTDHIMFSHFSCKVRDDRGGLRLEQGCDQKS
jgi:hypothetical protein